MVFDSPTRVYRNGVLIEQCRERTSNSPTRYRRYWTAWKVMQLTPIQTRDCDRFTTCTDDSGAKVIFTRTELLGTDLTKRQALALIGV